MVSMKMINPGIMAKQLAGAGKEAEKAFIYTLSNLAYGGRVRLKADLSKFLDRPSPATTRGVYYTKARPGSHPHSEVRFSPLAWKWMKYQVIGGQRTGATLSAPVAAPLNSYGNVVAGQRASKQLGKPGYFRAKMGGVDGLWGPSKGGGGAGISLQHVYKPSMSYTPNRLPMQTIVYQEARRLFPSKYKENMSRAFKRVVGI